MFITFEGGEGSGKSSVINEIEKLLINDGIDNFIRTREPGGIDIAESIRGILLNKKNKNMDKITEALLFAASRRQHLVEKIKPALDQGKIVMCDRFVDSSIVYQGMAREIGAKKVLDINKLAIEDYFPDITFLLDLDPNIGQERINKNSQREVNRLDLEKIEFHEKIRKGYLKLAKSNPDRFIVIDANNDIKSISEKIYKIIKEKIEISEKRK